MNPGAVFAVPGMFCRELAFEWDAGMQSDRRYSVQTKLGCGRPGMSRCAASRQEQQQEQAGAAAEAATQQQKPRPSRAFSNGDS